VKKAFSKFKYLGAAFLLIMFGIVGVLLNSNFSFAEAAGVIRVNDITVYDADNPAFTATGGYNADHNIEGIGYDVANHYLEMTSASVQSITADGDLVINLDQSNTIQAVDELTLKVIGNLKIIGSHNSSLSISALSPENYAIEIDNLNQLTVGDAANSDRTVTVQVTQGIAPQPEAENVLVIEGSFYTNGSGMVEVDPEPESQPLVLHIGSTLVIDESGEEPHIKASSGEGWNISQEFMDIYSLDIQNNATIGAITGTGDGFVIVTGPGTIEKTPSDFSVYVAGNFWLSTGENPSDGDINLLGGIFTRGGVETFDGSLVIGSDASSSPEGIYASAVRVGRRDLIIYTDGTALSYHQEPLGEEGLEIFSSHGKELKVAKSSKATEHARSATVSGGGIIDLSYTDSLGVFTPQSEYWPWINMSGAEEEENPQPKIVICTNGDHSDPDKYIMSTSDTNFRLQSTAGTLYNLGWNIPFEEDSIVTNGTVRVIAAHGYKFTSAGYTDYQIEAGSPVTIELLPDYGYQYVSGGLNGNPTTPEPGKASYTFIMPDQHLHLSAIFQKVDDSININSESVKSATINMPADEINGTAELIIDDAEVVDTADFETAAGDLTITNYLDLSLNEIINKGHADQAWTTAITDLSAEMTVNLELTDELQGYTEYAVLREHEGAVTELASAYNPNTGILSFKTGGYSNYAIARSSSRLPRNPLTYDGIQKYIALAITSFIGLVATALYGRKKLFSR